MKNIAIFVSGSGSNAENIVKYFKNSDQIAVVGIFSNKPDAYALERAKKLNVPSFVFSRDEFYESDSVLLKLKESECDLIVLAGFLWRVPDKILQAYQGRIINIHPALLPDYGGKGMYGAKVHEAVIKAGEKGSGITIHYVNENYDEGGIIFQAMCEVTPEDTPETLAEKVHALEYEFFPKVIESILESL